MTALASAAKNTAVALLCLGDPSTDDRDSALMLTPVYGRPLLHHLIKLLERNGISRFYIGVDMVPAALLSYRDAAANEGLDVRFVREPKSIAAEMERNARLLLLRTDVVFDSSILARALSEQRPLIATTEERSENGQFERIDLNNRWAGLAVIDAKLLDAMAPLPEGWDTASALLRQALQGHVDFWPVKQSDLQAGRVLALRQAEDIESAQAILFQPHNNAATSLENLLFSGLLAKVTPSVWSVSWGRDVSEWLFTGLALVAFPLSATNLPISALLVAFAAVIAFQLRQMVHIYDYQQDSQDWKALLGWGALSAALVGILIPSHISTAEAVFLGLVLVGLSLGSSFNGRSGKYWISSPLMILLFLSVGVATKAVDWMVRLLILAEIGMLLWHNFKGRSGVQDETIGLKPN